MNLFLILFSLQVHYACQVISILRELISLHRYKHLAVGFSRGDEFGEGGES